MPDIFKSIKNQDKFGYLVSLTYNCEGSSHKTLIGGIISLLITILYSGYIIYYAYLMFSNTLPSFSFYQNLQDFDSLDPFKLSDTNFFFYIWMRNEKTGEIVGFDDVKHLFRIYSYT